MTDIWDDWEAICRKFARRANEVIREEMDRLEEPEAHRYGHELAVRLDRRMTYVQQNNPGTLPKGIETLRDYCLWCEDARVRARWLCAGCTSYRAKYHRLPSPDVLERRRARNMR